MLTRILVLWEVIEIQDMSRVKPDKIVDARLRRVITVA